MDVREKLVELLTDNLLRIGNLPKCDNPLQYTTDEIVERIADHLIANGVTVQENIEISDELLKQLKKAPITAWKEEPSIEIVKEWISVTERLPESRKESVLIALRWGEVDIGWCEDGRWRSEFVNEYEDGEVTHWMPLPQPPKGE